MYKNLFEDFIENDLISQNQYGFKLSDSCINQWISIANEVYQSFDDRLEVRGAFLDISKAFGKVWHDGLVYKLNQNGVKGNFLDNLTNLLSDRKQRVVLNSQHSTWTNFDAGVVQGSILEPILFLTYINDSSDNLTTKPKLFADETSFFSVINDQHPLVSKLNEELNWK